MPKIMPRKESVVHRRVVGRVPRGWAGNATDTDGLGGLCCRARRKQEVDEHTWDHLSFLTNRLSSRSGSTPSRRSGAAKAIQRKMERKYRPDACLGSMSQNGAIMRVDQTRTEPVSLGQKSGQEPV